MEINDNEKGSSLIELPCELNDRLVPLMQNGVRVEQESAQIYEAMSSVAGSLGCMNLEKFFKIHSDEERKHSTWVMTFLKDKNAELILPEISKPEVTWKTVKDILEGAYKHEEFITNFWNKAATECLKVADHDAYQFACFILKEQREEIELFSSLVNLYNISNGNLLLFDHMVKHP